VTDAELRAARDFLVGVFPLRFETPGPVVGALSGIVVHDLPDDELARYRPAIEAVTPDDVHRAAREHLDVERAAILLVGDADAFGSALEDAGLGPIVVERDEGPVELVTEQGVEEVMGPVDQGPSGPTEGAEDPSMDGTDEPTTPGSDSANTDQR
jgi:hypothetical protein